jgi:hypothetical protein
LQQEKRNMKSEGYHGNAQFDPAGVLDPNCGEMGHGPDDDANRSSTCRIDDTAMVGEEEAGQIFLMKKRSGAMQLQNTMSQNMTRDGRRRKRNLFFKDVAAVPGHEILDQIGIADDEPGEDGGLGDGFEVPDGDDLFKMEDAAQGSRSVRTMAGA